MSPKTVIAIDGPAGVGKSTVAQDLARRLGVAYVDTGATYRLVALRALESSAPLGDPATMGSLASDVMGRCALPDGRGLTFEGRPIGTEIRTPQVSEAASIVAAHPEVRRVLVSHQRRLVPARGAVVEGRDIGTVVWPDAELKVYLDASPEIREGRRTSQHGDASSIAAELHERDLRDSSRPVGAMMPASDAVIIDTSQLSVEEVTDRVMALLEDKGDRLYSAVRAALVGAIRVVFRLEVTGRDNVPRHGGVILAPNHRSLLDIPVAAAATKRMVWFMAKDELFRSARVARIVRRLGGFPVRRGRPDRGALLRALELLDSGEVVGIFPEGTRRPGSRFEEVEEGFAYVALKSGAPIVPVAISGTEAVFPPDKRLPRPAKIRVSVGEPFRIGERHTSGMLARSRVREATAEAQRRLAAVMDALEPR